MNAALRVALKRAIDANARASGVLPQPGSEDGYCPGCGGDWYSNTLGCNTCKNRHLGRQPERRAAQAAQHRHLCSTDPAYRARRQAAKKASLERRRACKP